MMNSIVFWIALVSCCFTSAVVGQAHQHHARNKVKPTTTSFRRLASLHEVPDEHHRRLVRRLADSVKGELSRFHQVGVEDMHEATLEAGKLAQNLHKLVGGHVDLDQESRSLTVLAVDIGIKEHTREVLAGLNRDSGISLRGNRQLALTFTGAVWIIIFVLAIALVVGLAIVNILSAGGDYESLTFLDLSSTYLQGAIAEDYAPIDPCNRLPLRKTVLENGDLAEYSYLPMTGSFTDYVIDTIKDLFTGRRLQDQSEVEADEDASNGLEAFGNYLKMEYIRDNDIPNEATCLVESEKCFYNAECCRDASGEKLTYCDGVERDETKTEDEQKGTCVQVEKDGDAEIVIEPFCVMWSKSPTGKIDTVGFAPYLGWPPVNVDPVIGWLLPWCYTPVGGQCNFCELASGVEFKRFSTPVGIYQTTFQFTGIAFSWADDAKLELGEDENLQIWDGFLNRDLIIPDINFWTSFRLNVFEVTNYLLIKSLCEAGYGFFKYPTWRNLVLPFLKVEFEVFIGFDKKTYQNPDNSTNQELVDKQKEEFSIKIAGNDTQNSAPDFDFPTAAPTETSRLLLEDLAGLEYDDVVESNQKDSWGGIARRLDASDPDAWRMLSETDEGPCVVVAITSVKITIPVLGGLNFARAAGGWCRFSPEDTGVQCSPSGLFFNYKQKIEFTDGLLGMLGTFMDSTLWDPPTASDTQAGAVSFGVFFDDSKRPQAVVFRSQPAPTSFFGITVGIATAPVIHLQWITGSEVERRRKTVLRFQTDDGNWIPNCAQVGEECPENDWKWFYADQDEYDALSALNEMPKTQICESILVNRNQDDDKLLYYNRILTAIPVYNEDDPSDQYKIEPVYGNWMTPTRFDFSGENDLDNEIWIVYFGFRNIGCFVILLSELTVSLVLSEPLDSTGRDEDQLVAWIRLFCRVEVFSFVGIDMAFVFENYYQNDPKSWRIYGQLAVSALGMRSDVVISAFKGDFDQSRFRHLREDHDAYHRALASEAIDQWDWTAELFVSCDEGNVACEAFVAFATEAVETLAQAYEGVSEFFATGIKDIAQDIEAELKGWGESFIQGTVKTFEAAADAILEEDGLLNLMIPEERRQALEDGARSDIIEAFSTGGINEFADVGTLIKSGATLVGLEILEGLSDVVNFVTDIYGGFKNFVEDVSNLFEPWDEVVVSDWLDRSDCEPGCGNARSNNPSNLALLKEKCWCKDEFNCRVKVPGIRQCENKWKCDPFPPICWIDRVECQAPVLVDIISGDNFPRYDGQQYDKGCREERAVQLDDARIEHGKMEELGNIIVGNWNANFKGLFDFRPSRRRLNTGTGIQAGNLGAAVTIENNGSIDPSEPLAVETTEVTTIAKDALESPTKSDTVELSFDRSVYLRGEDGSFTNPDSETAMQTAFQQGTGCAALAEIENCDEKWTAGLGDIDPPSLSRSSDDDVVLSCSTIIADAWRSKMVGSDPDTIRVRRDRRLQGGTIQETILDRVVKNILLEKILNGTIPITVTPGAVKGGGDYLLSDFSSYGLNDQCSSLKCLNTANRVARRHLQGVKLEDFDWQGSLVSASATCTRYEWEFDVTAADLIGRSNAVTLTVVIPYGTSSASGTPTELQTRCQDTSIAVDALAVDYLMTQIYGEGFYKPSLSVDNCPNPNLVVGGFSDTPLNSATADPCKQDYLRIERKWDLANKQGSSCDVDALVTNPFFTQTITRGGLVVNGEPATPMFSADVVPKYELPNVPSPTVDTHYQDYIGIQQNSTLAPECGLCGPVIFNHSQPFDCSEVGTNTVEIQVTNGIGVSYANIATAIVEDNFAPNLSTKSPRVYLNEFGWLGATDRVTVDDVDDGTWDNCGIESRSVAPTPIYQCADEGPQYTNFTVTDVNGNTAVRTVLVTVDDSARKGIGDDAYLDLKTAPTNAYEVDKMMDDFSFVACKELNVYIRPDGGTNFVQLNGDWNGEYNWVIPNKYDAADAMSKSFFETLCNGSPTSGQECKGEVKAEVLCNEQGVGGGGGGGGGGSFNPEERRQRLQTCYRAKVFTAIQ